jgi:SagB-type dehydrogenase family enzyme
MDLDRETGRAFLKDEVRLEVDFAATAQSRGVAPPPAEAPFDPQAARIALPAAGAWQGVRPVAVEAAIAQRASRRDYTDAPLTLDELAFLLWACQGVKRRLRHSITLRTVPSAGARHPFEMRVAALRVSGLEPGVYRYLPVEHELLLERAPERLGEQLSEAALGQEFVGGAAVVCVWTVVPSRTEWRYAEAAYKVIAIDAGHVCQNLYLACECIGAGACAIAAYRQEQMDRLMGVDGREEFTIYLAPVGKVG